MAAKTPTRITQHWSIKPGDLRTARIEAAGLTLFVSNHRVQAEGGWLRDPYGTHRWLVAHDTRGTVATGATSRQASTYSSLVRCAMLEAEQAAAALQEVQ